MEFVQFPFRISAFLITQNQLLQPSKNQYWQEMAKTNAIAYFSPLFPSLCHLFYPRVTLSFITTTTSFKQRMSVQLFHKLPILKFYVIPIFLVYTFPLLSSLLSHLLLCFFFFFPHHLILRKRARGTVVVNSSDAVGVVYI